jgi:replication-associated recombination protein RarA|tara:strand:- start:413 stop:1363 length:951 start_codon:yes stop_codon:yes gene_type:complete
MNDSEFLFVEKYRPQKIEDIVLPSNLYDTFKDIVETGEIPNLLLNGTAGCGKTTVAKALCNELGADFIVINGSDEGRLIDTLRTKIKNFASTTSLQGGPKVVILDEADYISAESVQPALRGFIEEFSSNCRFIMTCNFKNRIINPLHSRCTVIDFKIPSSEKPRLASVFLAKLMEICTLEGIKFNQDVLAELIMKFFPDFRRCLNEVQRYGIGGTIDTGLLSTLAEEKITPLINTLKDKKWTEMRKWVGENSDNDLSVMYRKIFNALEDKLEPASIPACVLIIADYQYKSAFAADTEINLVACLTEIMSECKFRSK